MQFSTLNQLVFSLVATSIFSIGFVQPSNAAMLTTEQLIAAQDRSDTVSRIEATLLREDISTQLLARGVDPAHVMTRVNSMTTAELASLDGQINDQIAGSSALGVIGAVFLVLLILELVGITDVFKKI